MTHQLSREDFLKLFGNIGEAGYHSPTFLTDTKVGFSVQHNYPTNLRYKPSKTQSGEDDNVAVIWVVLEYKKKADGSCLIPIRLRIAPMSKYRAKNWDYDFDDPNSPTKDSLEESKNSPQPLELNLNNAYFFNPSLQKLVTKDGNAVSGLEILDHLFTAHCDTVHFTKGLLTRSKHRATKFSITAFDKFVGTLVWTLRNIFGRTLDESFDRSIYAEGYLKENFKKISIDSIEVAGYRASKRVIALFVLIVFALSFVLLPTSTDSYVGNLIQSDALVLAHFLMILYLLDEVLPNLIFCLLNKSIKARKWYLNRLLKNSI